MNTLIKRIESYQPETLLEMSVTACVLVLLMYDDAQNMFIILTKRPVDVKTYAGDYCFPGGMRETSDVDFIATVIREVQEELGLDEHHYQFIGQLDDFSDRYGHLVRPMVALIKKQDFEKHVQLSTTEVDQVFYFPLSELGRIKQNEQIERITLRRPSYIYNGGEVLIWGLTASIMVHLSNIIYQLDKPIGRGV